MKSRKESIVIDIPVDAIQYRHQVQLPDKVAASIRASILVEDPELHTLTSHIFNPISHVLWTTVRIKSPRGLRGGESALYSKSRILIGLPLWPELLGRRLQAADRTRPKLKLCSPPL